MFAVRFHGRGGQGVVTAAELLAAAFREDRHAQAFPGFGSEGMGAPLVSFCRIDDKPIRSREPVTEPDAILIQDPTLLHQADVFAGLIPGGYVLVNTAQSFTGLGLADLVVRHPADRLLTVPSSNLALTHLGRPLPGARRPDAGRAGRVAALAGVVSLEAVLAAIGERFAGPVVAGNAAAARAACDYVTEERKELAGAKADRGLPRRRRGRGRVPAAGDLRVPDHPADPHRRGTRCPGEEGGAERRLPQRRGRLQRRRARAAGRHDGRQPGDRRADQHLERPQRRDEPARRRLDPALRRDQPGSGRPAHPGAPYQPRQVLDPADPMSIGAMVGPEAYTGVRYCKSCGICAAECPSGAIGMVPEPA
jgi:pyruvate ferredoxin oxidoreductase gamma subunit